MKVYNKIVIDMNTFEVIAEDSYDYDGDIALCKGGGGASGAVSFPAYLEGIHHDWLDAEGGIALETSMTAVMNSALGSSPFSSVTAYDPDTDLTALIGHVTSLTSLVELLSSDTPLNTITSTILSDSRLVDLANDFDSDLSDQIDSNTLPQFEAGMRDINSVMSSTFVIGEAIIQVARVKESAKFLSALRVKAGTDDALKVIGMKLQLQQALTSLGIEANRIKIAAKSAETTQNISIDESDAKWDIELFQFGSNLLAGISGAAHYVPNKEGKDAGTAIGGALSGVAGGVSIGSAGGPIGMLIGGAAGGGLGYLASM